MNIKQKIIAGIAAIGCTFTFAACNTAEPKPVAETSSSTDLAEKPSRNMYSYFDLLPGSLSVAVADLQKKDSYLDRNAELVEAAPGNEFYRFTAVVHNTGDVPVTLGCPFMDEVGSRLIVADGEPLAPVAQNQMPRSVDCTTVWPDGTGIYEWIYDVDSSSRPFELLIASKVNGQYPSPEYVKLPQG